MDWKGFGLFGKPRSYNSKEVVQGGFMLFFGKFNAAFALEKRTLQMETILRQ